MLLIFYNIFYIICIIASDYYSVAFEQDKNCGHFDDDPVIKMNNGQDANIGDIPWIANFRLSQGQDHKVFCSGSIIHSEWVLTAAHCFASQYTSEKLLANVDKQIINSQSIYTQVRVHVGDLKLLHKEENETTHTIKMILIHSDYGTKGQVTKSGSTIKSLVTNDIALIRISPPINYHKGARHVCLPDNDEYGIDDVFMTSKYCQIAGWGESKDTTLMKKLQVGFVSILTPRTCEKSYGDQFNKTQMLCAGDNERGTDACEGDSGGPFTCQGKDDKYTLYGIISFGKKCNVIRTESIGIYTRVGMYKEWVSKCIDSLKTEMFGEYCLTLLQTFEKLKGKLIFGFPRPEPLSSSNIIIEHDAPPNSFEKKCSCDWRPISIMAINYQTTFQDLGRYLKKCFSYKQNPKNYYNAGQDCKKWESNLLTLKTVQELKDFTYFEGHRLPVWLALRYKAETNKLMWKDGTEVSTEISGMISSITKSCYKLIKVGHKDYAIIPEPCSNSVNFICETIESKYMSRIDIQSVYFNNVRRLKYCGSHINQTYNESGNLYSILVDNPNRKVFYGIIPKLGARKYRILEFDYSGEIKPALTVYYDRPQNNPSDIPNAPITEFGGMAMTPNGNYFILSDTVQQDRKVSTIHAIGLDGKGISSALLDHSQYYVIDVAVHSSGEVYLCNSHGRISIFKSYSNLKLTREFGQWIGEDSKLQTFEISNVGDPQYACHPENMYFTFTHTTYISIVKDWIYIVDQAWDKRQSRVQAFSISSRCPRSNVIPKVNAQIVRSFIESIPMAINVQSLPRDQFSGYNSDFGVNLIALVYTTSVQLYYHIRSPSRNEIQFVNRFGSYEFTFGYHGVTILKNHLLAIYDGSNGREKIVLFDII